MTDPSILAIDKLEVITSLEERIFGPFGRATARELNALLRDPTCDRPIRVGAAWVLARWNAHHGRLETARKLVGNMRKLTKPSTRMSRDTRKRMFVLEADLLMRLGKLEEAEQVIRRATERLGHSMEIDYLEANHIRLANPTSEETAAARLAIFNRELAKLNVAPLALDDSGLGFNYSNLRPRPLREAPAQGPKVSVLIPAHNAVSTLRTTITGLLRQTWTNLEIIVVDDASRDSTASITRALAVRDPRVKLLHHSRNRGSYSALNTALAAATGDFVTAHGADDWSHPERLQIQIEDLLHGNNRLNGTFGVRVTEDMLVETKPSTGGQLVRNMSSLMFHRADLEELGGWDAVRVGGDSELNERYAIRFNRQTKWIMRDAALTFVLTRPDSLTKHGPTSVATAKYGARRTYKAAATHWHTREAKAEAPNFKLPRSPRPFPAPHICLPIRRRRLDFDLLFVGDCSAQAPALSDDISMWSEGRRRHLEQALLEWPHYETSTLPISDEVTERMCEGDIYPVVWGERVRSHAVVMSDAALLDCVPDKLPQFNVGWGAIVDLEPDNAKGKSARRKARTQAFQRIFRVSPTWIGPAGGDRAQFIDGIADRLNRPGMRATYHFLRRADHVRWLVRSVLARVRQRLGA